MRKTSVVAGTVAVAAAGSAVLGGVALAGGEATNNCLNVGIPILSGIGVAGQGQASGASCSATANGTGGSAY